MSLQDPVSDMLTRLRNAQQAKKAKMTVRFSSLKQSILHVLKQEGYIEDYCAIQSENHLPLLEVTLKYFQNRPVIDKITRISKPSRRVYRKLPELKPVMGGLGIAIISTPKGVMTDVQARKAKHGGEVICEVI